MPQFVRGILVLMLGMMSGQAFCSDVTAVAFHPSRAYAYLGRISATQIQYCLVQPSPIDGLYACVTTGPTSFLMPISLAMHPKGKYLYVVDTTYQSVSRCAIREGTGQLIDCIDAKFTLKGPTGVAVTAQSQAYITHASGVSVCALDGNGFVMKCRSSGLRVQNLSAPTVAEDGANAYFLSAEGDSIWSCARDKLSGALNHCRSRKWHTLSEPSHGLARNIYTTTKNLNHEIFTSSFRISESGLLSFINLYPDGSTFRCIISQNTADFSACFSGGNQQGYAPPLSMIWDKKNNTHLYLLSSGQIQLMCSMDTDGTVSECTRTDPEKVNPWAEITS
ncbi:MAG: hypothetical protein NXI01_07515 [Gammaproteobacteria bacterium]|nr:hypothetical protein [Gammaproteobacteria bacterium]